MSICALIATFLFPEEPFKKPNTFPIESIQTSSIPDNSNLLANSFALFSSLKGGASISVSSIRFLFVLSSTSIIYLNASLTFEFFAIFLIDFV